MAVAVVAGIIGSGLPFPKSGTNTDPEAAASMHVPTATVPAYVGNDSCIVCHADQGREWSGSHHANAMAVASPSSVRGAFDGRRFTHQGVTSRFFRRGEQFFVHTQGPTGKLADFEIKYTFGVEPLQQYLIAMPGGRLQALQIAWDDQRKQWYHLRPDEKTPPGDVLHWTGRYQTANAMCIVCHTTAFERRYDAATDTYASTWKESNVSCQACHGPGEAHVTWAKASQVDRHTLAGAASMGLMVKPRPGDARTAQDICTPCHSRRMELSAAGVPGQPLLDHYLPSPLREGLYQADGQQGTEEVFVDGSYRQSKMFQKGVTCTNCHNPHTGKLRQQGNALCLQCHTTQQNAAFPGAAGVFDSPSHHFHAAGSPGAQCVGCHMPSRLYMGIQSRPDHSLRVPRPDLSAKTGTTNACNSCHTQQTAGWAAEKVAQWYGPKRKQGTHYGEVFANFRAGKAAAGPELVAVIADTAAPDIVRVTALDALRGDRMTGLPIRIAALSDPSDDVRVAAAASLSALEPRRRMDLLGPRLSDPLRAVRMAAVHDLSTIPSQQLDTALRIPFDHALKEAIAVQTLSLDMPGARLSLAQLLAAQGRNQEAQALLREGLNRIPADGEMHYALGLLLAQDGKTEESRDSLQKAAKWLPRHARVHYNLGLALQQLGQTRSAEQALLRAAHADETDADIAYALAAWYYKRQQYKETRIWVEKLKHVHPSDPRLAPLERALGGRAH